MHCVRVILNFVIVAQYNYHNETILSYLNHVLDKIDKLLKIFQKFRLLNKQTRKSYFNISKFHAITHYIEFIKLYKNSTNIDFDVDETNHKIFFKIFFSRINKKKNYEKQLLMHNIRRHNVLIIKNMLLYFDINFDKQININIKNQMNKLNRDRLNFKNLNIRNRKTNINRFVDMNIFLKIF